MDTKEVDLNPSGKFPSLTIEIGETDGFIVKVFVLVETGGQKINISRDVDVRSMAQSLNEFKDYLQAAILSPENEIVLRIPGGL